MELITRSEARSRGLKWYFNGTTCKNGHTADRMVSNKTCRICARAIQAKRAANAIIPLNKEGKRQWYFANKKRIRAEAAANYIANRDAICAKNKQYRDKTKAEQAARRRRHYESNKRRYIEQVIARRHAETKAMPSWANREAIRAIYERAVLMSAETGVLQHVDHIVPLRGKHVCGLHVESNLQIVPAAVNMRKHNTWSAD
jgi:hypothetical protein